MQNVHLITGATGFIGGALARTLVEQGERVRALVRPTSDLSRLDGLEVEHVVTGTISGGA